MKSTRLLAGALVWGALIAPASASPLDLTGTWVGQQTCTTWNGNLGGFSITDDKMTISQRGARLYIRSLFDPSTQQPNLFHTGVLIPSLGDPRTEGEASLIACGTNTGSRYQELGRVTSIQLLRPGSREALFVAQSEYNQRDRVTGEVALGSCQWAYQRVSKEDPKNGACGTVTEAEVDGLASGR